MTKFTAEQIGKQLFDRVSSIKLNDAAAIFGTTSRETMLQSLRKSVAELGAALAGKKSYDEIMGLYETMAGAVDTAGVTGLISEAEMADYYKLVDDLWAAIEKENK